MIDIMYVMLVDKILCQSEPFPLRGLRDEIKFCAWLFRKYLCVSLHFRVHSAKNAVVHYNSCGFTATGNSEPLWL